MWAAGESAALDALFDFMITYRTPSDCRAECVFEMVVYDVIELVCNDIRNSIVYFFPLN